MQRIVESSEYHGTICTFQPYNERMNVWKRATNSYEEMMKLPQSDSRFFAPTNAEDGHSHRFLRKGCIAKSANCALKDGAEGARLGSSLAQTVPLCLLSVLCEVLIVSSIAPTICPW